MSAHVLSPRDVRDMWARYHVDKALKRSINEQIVAGRLERLGISQPISDDEELPEPPPLRIPNAAPTDVVPNVCIIGAGAGGLFTAMLFDYLVQNVPSFKITYDIFEAQDSTSTSGRGVGGRLYTYNFSSQQNDYYDVGAMRFPFNPVMARTFALFKSLHMPTVQSVTSKTPVGSIIPYFIQGVNEPWYFNNIQKTGNYQKFAEAATDYDPFQLSDPNINPIDPKLLSMAAQSGTTVALQSTIQDSINKLLDSSTVLANLTEIDSMSTNEYLSGEGYNYNTIEWLETFQGGTGWYDQSHGETVLEFLDFDYPQVPPAAPAAWWCIEGGAQQLAIHMASTLTHFGPSNNGIQFSTQVNGIDVSEANNANISFKVAGAPSSRSGYYGVFNSTPLGCMAQMDLSKANLTYGQKLAIRSLGYGASCKVGMKFNTRWWRFGIPGFDFGLITSGGLGHSDLPIRTTVYPSYNINDPEGQTAVLLCSYEWQQDAQRIGTYISSTDDPSSESDLKELVLRDLALLHTSTAEDAGRLYDYLVKNEYVTHYAHDWYHDQSSFGAFAFFRPQQFGSMWPAITAPSPSLNIIGEHASTHHAWVVGALESALHGVYGWLTQQNAVPGAADAALFLEGLQDQAPALNSSTVAPTDTTGNVFGGLPPWTSLQQRKWQSVLGLLREEQFTEKFSAKKSAK